jgi:hypothetical protein
VLEDYIPNIHMHESRAQRACTYTLTHEEPAQHSASNQKLLKHQDTAYIKAFDWDRHIHARTHIPWYIRVGSLPSTARITRTYCGPRAWKRSAWTSPSPRRKHSCQRGHGHSHGHGHGHGHGYMTCDVYLNNTLAWTSPSPCV